MEDQKTEPTTAFDYHVQRDKVKRLVCSLLDQHLEEHYTAVSNIIHKYGRNVTAIPDEKLQAVYADLIAYRDHYE